MGNMEWRRAGGPPGGGVIGGVKQHDDGAGGDGSGARADDNDGAPTAFFRRWCEHGHNIGIGSMSGHSGRLGWSEATGQ